MARTAPLAASVRVRIKHRSALCSIGVPGAKDVLAIYLWWAKQHRFRALGHADLDLGEEMEIASSVASVVGEGQVELLRDGVVSAAARRAFEMKEVGFDLRGFGGQFE